jgi:hypothetical protein
MDFDRHSMGYLKLSNQIIGIRNLSPLKDFDWEVFVHDLRDHFMSRGGAVDPKMLINMGISRSMYQGVGVFTPISCLTSEDMRLTSSARVTAKCVVRHFDMLFL